MERRQSSSAVPAAATGLATLAADQPSTPTRVSIRWMLRRDMDDVLAIERSNFEFPWHPNDFFRCLRQRNCIGIVAECCDKDVPDHSEKVVAFSIYELHQAHIHILNLAIDRAFHRRSIGSQLINKIIAKLSLQRRQRITLEVRESNLAAQLFFRSLGFTATAVLRDFYPMDAIGEDAYLFRYRLQPKVATANSSPFERHNTDADCRGR